MSSTILAVRRSAPVHVQLLREPRVHLLMLCSLLRATGTTSRLARQCLHARRLRTCARRVMWNAELRHQRSMRVLSARQMRHRMQTSAGWSGRRTARLDTLFALLFTTRDDRSLALAL
ncbi:hypothetical protein DOTSEDRAFT_85537 [Dothistroma septosporum NZE10]|uniref:Uncharacterized protein n=1 Tax=Dothistroma septosporum (strain NZE10 / CBS 128990) TaxID=675120 RepID=N1Q5H6_DOTSN|nr:hypothetical protein DOTSEDRAFT_85537 [Dothistroma septosporum NZE10]